MPKKSEKLICGKTGKEIRKAYFNSELGRLLANIQIESELKKKDFDELTEFLSKVKEEEIKNIDSLIKMFGGKVVGVEKDLKPPSVTELTTGLSDEEWREKANDIHIRVKNLMDTTSQYIKGKKTFPANYWLDAAILINTSQEVLDKDRVYKDALYRKRLTEIIDEYDCSRKEAEERSKLTVQYRDYKEAVLLRERLDEFINLCKKKDAKIQ